MILPMPSEPKQIAQRLKTAGWEKVEIQHGRVYCKSPSGDADLVWDGQAVVPVNQSPVRVVTVAQSLGMIMRAVGIHPKWAMKRA